jgi:hypothetical protein
VSPMTWNANADCHQNAVDNDGLVSLHQPTKRDCHRCHCRHSIPANARYTKTMLTASINVLGHETSSSSVCFMTLTTIVFPKCLQ